MDFQKDIQITLEQTSRRSSQEASKLNKEQTKKKLQQINSEYNLSRAVLQSTGAFDMSSKSSDQLRSEIYAQYQKIWMKRERYTEHLKSLHDSEYYQTNEVFTALHNEIFSSSFQFLSKRIEKECD
eukprot:149115_1